MLFQVGLETYRVAHDAFGGAFGVVHHVVEVDHPALQLLLAREGQQLLSQCGGPLDRRARHGQIANHPVAIHFRLAHGAVDHLHVAPHDLQQVVEVVGDTPGQLPQGLHFLRLA
jgi:hypothetical protein